MRVRFFHTLPLFGLTLALFFASTGFMMIIQSGCPMMDESKNESCTMSCCGAVEPQTANGAAMSGPASISSVSCRTTTLAGLPSTLLSTPISRQNDNRIEFSHLNFLSTNIQPSIINHHSAIPAQNYSLPPPVERYVITSAFLI